MTYSTDIPFLCVVPFAFSGFSWVFSVCVVDRLFVVVVVLVLVLVAAAA